MEKNYQLIHKISSCKLQSTYVYKAVSLTNREFFTIKITDLDDLTDPDITLVN